MITVAKIGGKIFQVIKVVDKVAFSNERGWALITPDIDDKKSKALRWVRTTSNFIWVRTFDFD